MTFPELLGQYLQELDCTGKELAEISGIDPSVISRYRSGARFPLVDSDSFERLCYGLSALAEERNRPDIFEPDGVRESLLSVLPHSEIELESSLEKLRLLMRLAGVSQRGLAQGMHLDSSTVSRVLSGEHAPRSIDEFFHGATQHILDTASDRLPELGELTGIAPEELGDPKRGVSALYEWVTLEGFSPKSVSQPIHGFLQNLDDFDLNEYIHAIHFDELKVPTAPFQLPTSHTATGLKDMMDTELNFLKATVLSRSTHPVLIYSDMPMEKMAKDAEFPKKWMFGMAAMLKKGLRLNMIHNVNRPFREMMLGLEAYVPMYMTGQIAPYYLPEPPSKTFHHLLEVSGAAALSGEAIVGRHERGRYYLTKSREEIRYYQNRAEDLLARSKPLMDIFTHEREAELRDYLTRETQKPGHFHAVLSTLPLFTLSDELLERILKKNKVSQENQERISSYARSQRELFFSLPAGSSLTVKIPTLSKEEFANSPMTLSLSELFYEADVFYTWEDYQEHLALAEQFAAQREGIEIVGSRPVFRNIQILSKIGAWSIVSKNRSPSIHFVMRHPKLVNAIEQFAPPVVEE